MRLTPFPFRRLYWSLIPLYRVSIDFHYKRIVATRNISNRERIGFRNARFGAVLETTDDHSIFAKYGKGDVSLFRGVYAPKDFYCVRRYNQFKGFGA